MLYNQENYDGSYKEKAYQKYQLGWYFQNKVCYNNMFDVIEIFEINAHIYCDS